MKRTIMLTLELKEIVYIPEQCIKCRLDCQKVCGGTSIKIKKEDEVKA